MRMLYVQPASVKPGTDIVPKEFSERKRRKREICERKDVWSGYLWVRS